MRRGQGRGGGAQGSAARASPACRPPHGPGRGAHTRVTPLPCSSPARLPSPPAAPHRACPPPFPCHPLPAGTTRSRTSAAERAAAAAAARWPCGGRVWAARTRGASRLRRHACTCAAPAATHRRCQGWWRAGGLSAAWQYSSGSGWGPQARGGGGAVGGGRWDGARRQSRASVTQMGGCAPRPELHTRRNPNHHRCQQPQTYAGHTSAQCHPVARGSDQIAWQSGQIDWRSARPIGRLFVIRGGAPQRRAGRRARRIAERQARAHAAAPLAPRRNWVLRAVTLPPVQPGGDRALPSPGLPR